MVAIVTFSASLLAIASLFALKDWELRRRTKLFFDFRGRLNSVVTAAAEHVLTRAPVALRETSLKAKRLVRHGVAFSIHTGLARLEHALERALRALRYQRIRAGHTVSPFLRDVAEHKRSLDKSGI